MIFDVFGLDRRKYIDKSDRPRFSISKNIVNTMDSAVECVNFTHDCLLMVETQGENALKNAQEIADTAIISHKHLVNSEFYYDARKRLMEQQLKVVARCLKRLQKKYQVRAIITVFESSNKSWWMYMIGDMCFYTFKDNQLERMLPKNLTTKQAENIKINGIQILDLETAGGELVIGERFLLINRNLQNSLSDQKIADIISKNVSEKDLTKISQQIIDLAKKKDKNQAYGVYLWERLP